LEANTLISQRTADDTPLYGNSGVANQSLWNVDVRFAPILLQKSFWGDERKI
jgi:hypothetical protein